MTHEIWKSAFIAAFFALHPLHVESVAWISERKDVLSAFFWMLTLCCYVYYTEKPIIKRYLLVLFSFVLALMSKPMVITLPVIMMLLDYWPLKRFQSQKENVLLWQFKEKLPLLMLSIIFSIITIYAQYKPPVKIIPLNERLTNASFSFLTYLERIFWPQNLSFFYSFPEQMHFWKISGTVLLIIIASLAVTILARRFPYLFVGWFWYAIIIAPVLGITYTGVHWMHDLYTYLPSIGIVIGMAWGLPALVMKYKIMKNIIFPLTIVLLAILSVFSWKQTGYWRNSIELFTHALHLKEDNYLAHDQRGIAYGQAGQYQQAISDFNRAIELNPDYYKGYNNRGFAYAKTGQYQNAVNDYSEAIRLKPDYAKAYDNRAMAHLNQGNYLWGCRDAQKACELGACSALKTAVNNGHCL
jgi:tetratricopeptide (TPR) repeat protein